MLYEKKMLILSGEGKGVVLIEKSARGLRFSLSTFDMPTCGELKAGVITPRAVFVRDLPQRDNPSSVFIVEADSADNLHFAVFDTKLRLYGTNGKRMWEANVMDLLCKNDRRMPPQDERNMLAALPPISKPPKVLPMPDGTGLPQSRLEIYGDEAIAESNFYTPIDISSRMPIVDKFLDTPRVTGAPSILDGLAPTLETHTAVETTAIAEDEEIMEALPDTHEEVKHTIIDSADIEDECVEETSINDSDKAMPAAAATVDSSYRRERPCEMAARWLKKRSKRPVINKNDATVKPITSSTQVKQIREVSFIERSASDIEKLFDSAEKDEKLCSLLPEVQWVKVPIDGHVISVGRGGNDFLCYAVFGTYEKTSPLGDEAQWLPENKSIPTGKGYWLIFQSLKDGEIIQN